MAELENHFIGEYGTYVSKFRFKGRKYYLLKRKGEWRVRYRRRTFATSIQLVDAMRWAWWDYEHRIHFEGGGK